LRSTFFPPHFIGIALIEIVDCSLALPRRLDFDARARRADAPVILPPAIGRRRRQHHLIVLVRIRHDGAAIGRPTAPRVIGGFPLFQQEFHAAPPSLGSAGRSQKWSQRTASGSTSEHGGNSRGAFALLVKAAAIAPLTPAMKIIASIAPQRRFGFFGFFFGDVPSTRSTKTGGAAGLPRPSLASLMLGMAALTGRPADRRPTTSPQARRNSRSGFDRDSPSFPSRFR